MKGRNCELKINRDVCNGNGFKVITMEDPRYYLDSKNSSAEIPSDNSTINNLTLTNESSSQIFTSKKLQLPTSKYDSCLCYNGYSGDFCDRKDKKAESLYVFSFLKNKISNIFTKVEEGCPHGYTGSNCKFKQVSYRCNLQGFYDELNKSCVCHDNYMGEACEIERFSQFCNRRG